MIRKEHEAKVQEDTDKFKQSVFAHAFSALDQRAALKQYYEVFEKPELDDPYNYEYEEYVPETEQDVEEMLNAARRLGVVR